MEDYDAEPGELRFDMFEAEFTHEGDKCSFEVMLFVGGVPSREIARRIGVAPSTVRTTIERFRAAGLTWPRPEEMTDSALEAKLFADAGTEQGHRRQVEPEWASVHRELKRKHATLSILWDQATSSAPIWSPWLATARSVDPDLPDVNKSWDLSFREELRD